MSTKELEKKILDCKTHHELKILWINRKDNEGNDLWPKGKLMEFLIVRAFELESSDVKPVYVTYPFGVREKEINNEEMEQIDGAVHVMTSCSHRV